MNFACPTCGELDVCFFADDVCTRCCKVCREADKAWLALVSFGHDNMVSAAIKRWMTDHVNPFHKRISKSHKGNGAPIGRFAFTLTKSPNDDLTEDQMILAVRKLMAQKSCPVQSYAWYLEYGNTDTKTNPHIHGLYETEGRGRIERKHFKRAWPIWDETVRMGAGFRGGYHRPVRDNESYADYIKKQDGVSDKFGVE